MKPQLPANLDPVTAKDIDEQMTDRFGVVYTISPSPLAPTMVWVGTDDGLIHVTADDGKHWTDATPPEMTAWSKVSQVEAGHFDRQTAYASVDRHRINDVKPYIYKTSDGGKHWTSIVSGIPEGAYVNSVKEDPKTQRPPLRRHRAARLRLLQRRRLLAAAPEQHAGHQRPRPHRPRRGPRRRHPWPRLLGHGSDDRAPPARGEGN